MKKLGLIFIAIALLVESKSSPSQAPLIPAGVLEKMQSITEQIRACSEVDITPVDPTAKERVPFKLLDGPPLNVTWDIKKSDSLIKPYYGVIEFVTYGRMWAPDDLMQRNKRLAEMVSQYNLKPEALRHRYVFEPVHGALELTTMTEVGSDMKEMTEPKTYRCWQLAAGVEKPE